MARMGQDASSGYTGAFDMPAGTTAQRPATADLGFTRLNTDTGSVEVYDGSQWNAVTRPFISSVTGTIYAGAASNLVVNGQNFTSTITVRFLEGGSTVADVTGVSVSSGSATVAVPAAVYGQTAGDSIEVKVINSDGTMSANGITKTVVGLPTGGTITTSGGYRIHTFTSSSSLSVPTGFSANAEYVVVAGGGGGAGGVGGAGVGGAGGAGGYRSSVVGESSGGGASAENIVGISSGTYTVTVGAGGSGASGTGLPTNGANSVFGSITSIGGGFGGQPMADAARSVGSGGSGGGAGQDQTGKGIAPGSGTSGQGYAGGANGGVTSAGGGGGAGGAGATGPTGTGGAGVTSSINGTSTARAGGGGGGRHISQGGTSSGQAGGGNGTTNNGTSGAANTGGGGGGAGEVNQAWTGGNGGSGIVIVRYAL